MTKTLNALFEVTNFSFKKQLYLAWFFLPFTILALGIDSTYFQQQFFDGQIITNILAIIYFGLFFKYADAELRKLLFLMVFLSYLGELIFCKLLGMYSYRTDNIPLYVPFGHAIVYGSGYVFAQTNWTLKKDNILRKFFTVGFAILFLSVAIILNDVFSLIFGALFFVILKRKRWQNLYYCIALCVIYIELVGTYFQCWAWVPKMWNWIPTINPPMGAVFFYAGGDVLLAKMVKIWNQKKNKSISI